MQTYVFTDFSYSIVNLIYLYIYIQPKVMIILWFSFMPKCLYLSSCICDVIKLYKYNLCMKTSVGYDHQCSRSLSYSCHSNALLMLAKNVSRRACCLEIYEITIAFNLNTKYSCPVWLFGVC